MAEPRLTADEMDQKRLERDAYQYLCHLQEAKEWLQRCLGEELPPATELEEQLRNGVYLARLAHFFAPEIVPESGIFDMDQKRYKKSGLHYRHTDNIMRWMRAMQHVELPKIFIPETTDIYEKKNIPRAIYCLHALSLQLFQLGLAPQIKDLYGKVDFTKEEITAMARELKKYGLKIESFRKIGGLIAKDVPVNEAELHAAIIAINESVQHKSAQETAKALENPAAHLRQLNISNADSYHTRLKQAQFDKAEAWKLKSAAGIESQDVYDEMLTQAEIQGNIKEINVAVILNGVPDAILAENPAVLLELLQKEELNLKSIRNENAAGYFSHVKQWTATHPETRIERDQLQPIINTVNKLSDQVRDRQEIVRAINCAVQSQDKLQLQQNLKCPEMGLTEIDPDATRLALEQMVEFRKVKNDDLSYSEIYVQAVDSNFALAVNRALDRSDSQSLHFALFNSDAQFFVPPTANINFCLNNLLFARQAKVKLANAPLKNYSDQQFYYLTHAQIQVILNQSVKNEGQKLKAETLHCLNEALHGGADSRRIADLLHSPELQLPLNDDLDEKYVDALRKRRASNFQRGVSEMFGDEVLLLITAINRGSYDQHYLNYVLHVQKQFGDAVDQISQERMRDKSATVIQSNWKAYDQRLKYMHFRKAIILIQSWIRLMLFRRRYLKRLALFKANEAYIRKIQKYYRSHRTGKKYKELLSLERPSVDAIRPFIPMLQLNRQFSSGKEFDEFLKTRVQETIRKNRKLEAELKKSDQDIGLLVKNKISLQEALQRQRGVKSTTRKGTDVLENAENGDDGLDLKSGYWLDKLDTCQQLLYILQTKPIYLTRLLFALPAEQTITFLESLILSLFGYATDHRENCLVTRLWESALQHEIRHFINDFEQFLNSEPMVARMVVSFYRNTEGERLLTQHLGLLIRQLLDDSKLEIYTQPLELYELWAASHPSAKMVHTIEEAMQQIEVRELYLKSLEQLQMWTQKFLDNITQHLDAIPFGLRYQCAVIRRCLHEKFPDLQEKLVLKAVANIVYHRYLQPVISSPDAFGLIQNRSLTTEDRKRLTSIAKLIEVSAQNKGFGGENSYLSSLNLFINNAHQQINPEQHFNRDPYSEHTASSNPTVHISLGEIIRLHQLLCEYENTMAPDPKDIIHRLLSKLGKERLNAGMSESLSERIERSEMQLVLSAPPQIDDQQAEIDALFLKTKALLLDVILCCRDGHNVSEVLEIPCTDAEEHRYTELMNAREKMQLKMDAEKLSLEDKKRAIISNLYFLEQHGVVCREDNHQRILDAITSDIKAQRNRQTDRAQLNDTLRQLHKKSQHCEAQIEAYQQYLDACLRNLEVGNKRNSYGSQRDSGEIRTLSSTADKLHKKGLLLDLEQHPSNQWKHVYVDFTSSRQPGELLVNFRVPGSADSSAPAGASLHFQDLLRLQHSGVSVVRASIATFNVASLIRYINRKFYTVKKKR